MLNTRNLQQNYLNYQNFNENQELLIEKAERKKDNNNFNSCFSNNKDNIKEREFDSENKSMNVIYIFLCFMSSRKTLVSLLK